MKNLIIFVLLIISTNLFGQTNSSIVDVRFGMGVTLLGTGDIIADNYETQMNYKFNKYLSGSISINLGIGNSGIDYSASFKQSNLNLYLSPFRNNRKNDFRIGGGISYYSIYDVYLSSSSWENGELLYRDYKIEERKSFGINIIIENTYSITNRVLMGVKIITQPYFNGDINSGWFLKTGFKL